MNQLSHFLLQYGKRIKDSLLCGLFYIILSLSGHFCISTEMVRICIFCQLNFLCSVVPLYIHLIVYKLILIQKLTFIHTYMRKYVHIQQYLDIQLQLVPKSSSYVKTFLSQIQISL